MAISGDAIPTAPMTADRAPATSRLTIPSWLTSLGLHVMLLMLVAPMLKSCGQGGTAANPGEGFRSVGIVVKESNASEPTELTETTAESSTASTDSASSPSSPSSSTNVPEQAPAALEFPSDSLPTIGAGGTPLGALSTGASDIGTNLLQPAPVSRPTAGGGALAGVEFFDVHDRASQFVYLLDRSGSMDGAAIRIAKAELIASLQTLNKTQQFQVIFYSNAPIMMDLDRKQEPAGMYWATSLNRTRARHFINSVQPEGGTNHLDALLEALRLNPEVIFFLSDADTGLTTGDLHEIDRRNRGGTRIHCIEFGKGADLTHLDNFLKKLARQSGGTYRYRNIDEFGP